MTVAHPLEALMEGVLSTVRPLHKTAHAATIDPTFLDLATADWYMPVFFAYRLTDKSDAAYSELIRGIKESLQKVLVPFFSFAGRWIDFPKGSCGRQLLCNDEGVPFIEAFIDKDLDSVVQASIAFQPVPQLHGYGRLGMDECQLKQKMKANGLPAIFVQTTRFKCGGMVLAVSFNHMHMDATGFFKFMVAWSDISRVNETTVKVDHNRGQIDVPAIRALASPEQQADTVICESDVHFKPTILKVFQVSASTIKALKQEAKANNKEAEGYVSTVDCIVAHFWRSSARLPSRLLGDRKLTAISSVEGRTRMLDPPLPDLCGNVITAMLAPDIAAEELRNMPLVTIAGKFRQTLQTTRKEDWFAVDNYTKGLSAFGPDHAVLLFSSWLNFPMYDVDFGFGKPFFVPGVNLAGSTNSLGAVVITPPIPACQSSVATLYFISTPTVIEALEQDDQFSAFFA